jgi:predicted lysophospholipase L1 biosynthesis ABC-type transport system permease subunit
MTIVGTAAFPRLNHGSFSLLGLGTGAMALAEVFPPFDLQALGDPPPGIEPVDFIGPDGENFGFVTIRVRPDATPRDRREIVTTASDIGDANMQIVRLEQRPTAIDSYADVRSTPFVLAVLLGAMATATLTHLVANVVRRRRRDLALCAALGMRGAQLLSAVVIQAVIVAGAALVIGLPLGVAAGRVAWSGFASDLGVVDTLRFPIVALLLAVPVVLIVAVTVAAVPAVVAARTRPALVLRSE